MVEYARRGRLPGSDCARTRRRADPGVGSTLLTVPRATSMPAQAFFLAAVFRVVVPAGAFLATDLVVAVLAGAALTAARVEEVFLAGVALVAATFVALARFPVAALVVLAVFFAGADVVVARFAGAALVPVFFAGTAFVVARFAADALVAAVFVAAALVAVVLAGVARVAVFFAVPVVLLAVLPADDPREVTAAAAAAGRVRGAAT